MWDWWGVWIISNPICPPLPLPFLFHMFSTGCQQLLLKHVYLIVSNRLKDRGLPCLWWVSGWVGTYIWHIWYTWHIWHTYETHAHYTTLYISSFLCTCVYIAWLNYYTQSLYPNTIPLYLGIIVLITLDMSPYLYPSMYT